MNPEMDHAKAKHFGKCGKCSKPSPVDEQGRAVHHYRLRRHRWLSCPGSGELTSALPMPRSVITKQLPRDGAQVAVVDRRASSAPTDPLEAKADEIAASGRYVAGVDPANPELLAITDTLTGEIVYRRPKRKGAPE